MARKLISSLLAICLMVLPVLPALAAVCCDCCEDGEGAGAAVEISAVGCCASETADRVTTSCCIIPMHAPVTRTAAMLKDAAGQDYPLVLCEAGATKLSAAGESAGGLSATPFVFSDAGRSLCVMRC